MPLPIRVLLSVFSCFHNAAAWPAGVDDTACAAENLTPTQHAKLMQLVEANPVTIVAFKQPMRCTLAALARLDASTACYEDMRFRDEEYQFGQDSTISAPLWRYHVCQYPDNKVGGAQMHSYIWIGGQMHGNGFDLIGDRADSRLHGERWLSDADLQAKLAAAGAVHGCQRGRQQQIKSEVRRETRRKG